MQDNQNKEYWDNFISGIIAYVYGIREKIEDKPPVYQEGFVFAAWREKEIVKGNISSVQKRNN